MAQQGFKLTRNQVIAALIVGLLLAVAALHEDKGRGSSTPQDAPCSSQTTQERPSH
ncbi:hypothetical protein ACQEU6_37140 [Spirillospora sp. CA-108201]